MQRDFAEGFEISRLARDFLDYPFSTYHALRRHAPVKRMADCSVFLTRYADVAEVYRDAARYSSDKKLDFRRAMGDTPLYEHHTTSLVFNEARHHTRVRKRLMSTAAGLSTRRRKNVPRASAVACPRGPREGPARGYYAWQGRPRRPAPRAIGHCSIAFARSTASRKAPTALPASMPSSSLKAALWAASGSPD